MSALFQPYPLLNDTSGKPLSGGYVYMGQANQDPQQYPVAVFWDQALTIPAAQPLRTDGGFIVRNGAPANVWTAGEFSLLVLDRLQRQVFYVGVASRSLDAVSFLQAGTGAVTRSAQDKAREIVSVADFGVRASQSASTNTTKLQAAMDYFAGTPVTLVFSEPIQIAGTINYRAGISLRKEAFGSITAAQVMGAMFQSPIGELVEDCSVVGLGIFCDGKANTAFDLQCFRNCLLQDVLIEDWLTDAVIAGNDLAPQTSYELRTLNLWTHRRVAAIPAGSRGLYLRSATDCKINATRIVGGEIGIYAGPGSGGNIYTDVHCWARESTGLMKRGFVADNADQKYTACYADTPSEYGWYLSQNNHDLVNCRVYNNGAVADNTAVGIYFNSNDPRSTVSAFQAEGISGTRRMARDIGYLSAASRQSLTISGSYGYNVTIQEPPTSPTVSAYTTVTAGGGNGLVSDGAAGTARNASWTTAGVLRWSARASNTAETGANAGSNWQLVRRADDGSVLGTSIDITRSNGTIVMTDGTVQVAGTWQKPFRFGNYSTWVNVTSGNFYIKNGIPTSDTDGTVVGTQA